MEARLKLHPVRLSMDKASVPVVIRDMANLADFDIGLPCDPSLPSEGVVLGQMAGKCVMPDCRRTDNVVLKNH